MPSPLSFREFQSVIFVPKPFERNVHSERSFKDWEELGCEIQFPVTTDGSFGSC